MSPLSLVHGAAVDALTNLLNNRLVKHHYSAVLIISNSACVIKPVKLLGKGIKNGNVVSVSNWIFYYTFFFN